MGDYNYSFYKSVMKDCCIIFFIKNPEKGRIKTRLAKDLNEDFVLDLYKCFVLDILAALNNLKFDFKIFYDPPGCLAKIKEWLGEHYSFVPQKGEDLGLKMKNAFFDVFKHNYNKAIIIGSDTPNISNEVFINSFNNLDNNDAVIGPSFDGGYYLLGFNKETFLNKVFYNIEWSSEKVFNSTIDIFKANNYKVDILNLMNDIDTISDLRDFVDQNKENDFKNSNTMKYIFNSKILLN